MLACSKMRLTPSIQLTVSDLPPRCPPISDEEFSLLMNGEGLNQEKHKAAADYALPIILNRSKSRSLERSVNEGFDHAAKQLGIKRARGHSQGKDG